MIESVLQQAPEGVSRERVEEIYKKHDGNVSAVLAELWEVEEVCKNVAYDENSSKWKNIREICQAYEEEMANFWNAQKKSQTQ